MCRGAPAQGAQGVRSLTGTDERSPLIPPRTLLLFPLMTFRTDKRVKRGRTFGVRVIAAAAGAWKV